MKTTERYVSPPDISLLREKFAGIDLMVNGRQLIYFDNSATTLRLKEVVQTLCDFYYKMNSNIHRAVHTLADMATEAYENARKEGASFLGATPDEVFFVRSTTEAINVIANGMAHKVLKCGDGVLLTEMEHHSNIVPWQMVREKYGINIYVVPVTEDGELDYIELQRIIEEHSNIKVISVTHVSNVLGTINDIKRICHIAREKGIYVVVDGAQAVAHIPINVKELGCDAYVFSGHKVFGPFGVGVAFISSSIINDIYPYLGGGSMIESVSFEKTTFLTPPLRFEGGTPPVADAVALAPALKFMRTRDAEFFVNQEHELARYFYEKLRELDFIRIIGTSSNRIPVFSFVVKGAHSYDVGVLLNQYGIAVRTGHHCAEPLHKKFKVEGTVRASLALYNTKDEIDTFINALKKVYSMLI